MKKIAHYINVLIWALAGLYLAVIILVNIPAAQSYIGARVASALSRKLDTKVEVGRVNLGFFNRIIVDDILLHDQQGQHMLRAGRVSVRFDYLALLRGRVAVSSAQLFGVRANLYKATDDAKPNFQFVLDSLASKDTTRRTPLDLELRSLIIRHGEVAYNQLDAPRRASFDTRHLRVTNLSSHIILNTLTDDSLNLNVKRLSLREASGLDVRSLRLRLVANRRGATLSGFDLELPASRLTLGDLTASYRLGDHFDHSSLRYAGSIAESHIAPRDLAALSARLRKFARPVVLASTFSGTATSLRLASLRAAVPQPGHTVALASPADIRLDISGAATGIDHTPIWTASIAQLMVDEDGLEMLAGNIPDAVARMNSIDYRGQASGQGTDVSTRGVLRSGVGNANLALNLRQGRFTGHLDTQGINLRQLLANPKFGILAANVNVEGDLRQKLYKAKGSVRQLDYNDYAYHNLVVDGSYRNGLVSGKLDIDDPNLAASVNGSLNTNVHGRAANLTADIRHFCPATVHLLESRLGRATYSGRLVASFTGSTLNTARGSLAVTGFSKRADGSLYALDTLRVEAGNNARGHYLSLRSDFADAEVQGRFDYATLVQSVKNAIVRKLPGIQNLTPIKFRRTRANDFTVRATIRRTDWLREFAGIDADLRQPLRLSGSLSSAADNIELNVFAPDLTYKGTAYRQVSAVVTSPDNHLNADLSLVKVGPGGVGAEYRLEASATDDQLASVLTVDNHAARRRLTGRLNSTVRFERGAMGQSVARMAIEPSAFSVGDSAFDIHPSTIVYSKNRLEVHRFAMTRGQQHVVVDGTATADRADSLAVDLNDVDVSYILDLVNFHTVDFSGRASGRAHVAALFGKPEAWARLSVADFRFQQGRMGTLQARVKWNADLEEIDIDAQARDTMLLAGQAPRPRTTNIDGYVSPRRNYIDLAIEANDTRAEFAQSFCESFMDEADITANGHVRLWGDLGELNLTGELVANGSMRITPLNTVYTLRNDTIRCLVNEMQFRGDTILDRNGNTGIVSGSLYHDHLSHLRYDIRARARHLLAYDWGPTYGSTFYGTVYGTGDIGIRGRSGEVNIDVNVTPEQGSQVVYDVSSPDAISAQEFIHWTSRDSLRTDTLAAPRPGGATAADIPTDIRINFLINATPDATLKLIMDRATGDYITLNGTGGIRAAYYNKGGLDLFGNYIVDRGLYKLTIQNVIKKDFVFAPGGTIVFGGDPYAANLNLQAQYILNSVSLSDLQIGRSFSGNNIRVNCIMNITGTPAAPRVGFDLDMPTVGTDAKQMIYSLINSEEEMNQQVLYLLAVGRFYAPGSNNAATGGNGDSQTSLAMQSILSGQLSQQINNVLSSVVKNNDWNFGANISTGDEGWNNAEYEGLLSGRMLNNRLLFNGQFGYRDNANATTSFIGDFDLRYLITPNGNLSVHVYNQTNDRYFTRSTLNTQGLGFIIKKDFDTWRSLFRSRKKKK